MKRKISAGRIFGKLAKYLFVAIIMLVNGILIWRMCSSGTPKELITLTANDKLAAAYSAYKTAPTDKEFALFNQGQNSITRADENYGYFSVEYAVFIPDINQVQIVFRYNNSTIRALAEDYKLESIPERSEELFDVTLIKTKDLTPDNEEDNIDQRFLEKTRYFPSYSMAYQKNLYNYRKLVFDDVSAEDAIGIFADIYYVGAKDYEQAPYGTLCLYDNGSTNRPIKLSNSDIKAIEAYIEEKSGK